MSTNLPEEDSSTHIFQRSRSSIHNTQTSASEVALRLMIHSSIGSMRTPGPRTCTRQTGLREIDSTFLLFRLLACLSFFPCLLAPLFYLFIDLAIKQGGHCSASTMCAEDQKPRVYVCIVHGRWSKFSLAWRHNECEKPEGLNFVSRCIIRSFTSKLTISSGNAEYHVAPAAPGTRTTTLTIDELRATTARIEAYASAQPFLTWSDRQDACARLQTELLRMTAGAGRMVREMCRE